MVRPISCNNPYLHFFKLPTCSKKYLLVQNDKNTPSYHNVYIPTKKLYAPPTKQKKLFLKKTFQLVPNKKRL